MARHIVAVCRLCRRVSEKLMLKGDRCVGPKCGIERRSGPPGRHAAGRQKISDRGLQLREKQKARYVYGVLERQFRGLFNEAARIPGITGDNLLILLERRLDNVVFRLGFASSRAQARQIVRHGHLMVNKRRTDIPSFLTKPGDVIEWGETGKKNEYYKSLVETIEGLSIPTWLSLDKGKLEARVLSLPGREEIGVKLNQKAIVEYYSR